MTSFCKLTVLMLAMVVSGCETSTPVQTTAPSASSIGTVGLTLKYNEVDQTFAIPCSKDSTVFSILQRAENLGDIELDAKETSQGAFVKSINGLVNNGANKENWIYRVNETPGTTACDQCPVKVGDQVVWSFEKFKFD